MNSKISYKFFLVQFLESQELTQSQPYADPSNTTGKEIENREEIFTAYTTAVAIARMACADCMDSEEDSNSASNTILTPLFIRNALFDLLTLCSSRIIKQSDQIEFEERNSNLINSMNSHQNKKRKSTNEKRNSDESVLLSTYASMEVITPSTPNFNVVLIELLNFIALKRGYENSSLLLFDHSRHILSKWLESDNSNNDSIDDVGNEINDDNNNDNNNNNNNLLFYNFPWKILSPQSGSYVDFLKDFSSMIIPIICKGQSPRKRWRLLLGIYICVHECALFC